MGSKKKILVIQPMVGIGDMVWHKPWLDGIIANHNITLMAKPSSQAAAVLCDHPDLEIIPLHRAERGRKKPIALQPARVVTSAMLCHQ